jgi:Restriction endonuclease
MTTPHEKGNLLELAVHAIEAAILRASPSYNEKTFRIEMKKIITVNGVRHEIDIFVSVDIGSGYEAVFIFECKNWEDKVGKNDLIVFTEKIKATQAQKGFFVARSFTRDAEAQAGLEPRIELLRVADLPAADVPVPFGFHGVNRGPTSAAISVYHAGARPDAKPHPIDTATAIFKVNGEHVDFNGYIRQWIDEEAEARMNRFPSTEAVEGTHELEFESTRTFYPATATLDEKGIDRIELKGTTSVQVIHATMVSHFQLATRGRALTVGLNLGGADIHATFVMLPGV